MAKPGRKSRQDDHRSNDDPYAADPFGSDPWDDGADSYDPYVDPVGTGPMPGRSRKRTKSSAQPTLKGTGNEPPAAQYQRSSGVDGGMILKGVAMMVGAVVWFVAGWSAGRIFFYPPILLVIGLVTAVRGLFGQSE
ncbi:MAG: hypothetical protein R3C20_21785 [Planctomycetaceae bacterium]